MLNFQQMLSLELVDGIIQLTLAFSKPLRRVAALGPEDAKTKQLQHPTAVLSINRGFEARYAPYFYRMNTFCVLERHKEIEQFAASKAWANLDRHAKAIILGVPSRYLPDLRSVILPIDSAWLYIWFGLAWLARYSPSTAHLVLRGQELQKFSDRVKDQDFLNYVHSRIAGPQPHPVFYEFHKLRFLGIGCLRANRERYLLFGWIEGVQGLVERRIEDDRLEVSSEPTCILTLKRMEGNNLYRPNVFKFERIGLGFGNPVNRLYFILQLNSNDTSVPMPTTLSTSLAWVRRARGAIKQSHAR